MDQDEADSGATDCRVFDLEAFPRCSDLGKFKAFACEGSLGIRARSSRRAARFQMRWAKILLSNDFVPRGKDFLEQLPRHADGW
jgi:hypothetical protein